MAEWNPDDPDLKGMAAYEPPAVFRWHKAHVPPKDIMRMLKLRGSQLAKQIEAAAEEERKAIQVGMPVHDPGMPEETQ